MKKKVVIDKTFRNWTRRDLQKYLGVNRSKNFQLLQDWFDMEIVLTQEEIDFLEELRDYIEEPIDLWNEAELRENFISELTRKVKFRDRKKMIANFAERYFSVSVEKGPIIAKLHGYVDWMVARGIGKPERPYFFIHEYKPAEGQTNDGKGQLLAAMYTVRHLHQKTFHQTLFEQYTHYYRDMPIYGIYVIGRYWYFVVLQGDTYEFSEGHISTKKEDLQTIFKLLKAQKQLIFSRLEKQQLKTA